MVYLDTSAIVSLVLSDGHSETVLRWLDRRQAPLVASNFGCLEFAAVVGRRVRARTLSETDGDRVLAAFDVWMGMHARVADVEAADHRAAAAFVRRYALGLRAPDALHIATCVRLRLPMLTFDTLQAAAARELGVPVEVCP